MPADPVSFMYKDGDIEGCIALHVGDALTAGNKKFFSKVYHCCLAFTNSVLFNLSFTILFSLINYKRKWLLEYYSYINKNYKAKTFSTLVERWKKNNDH